MQGETQAGAAPRLVWLRSDLRLHDNTALKCNACRRVYPIKDDIPVMLIDEATIEENDD